AIGVPPIPEGLVALQAIARLSGEGRVDGNDEISFISRMVRGAIRLYRDNEPEAILRAIYICGAIALVCYILMAIAAPSPPNNGGPVFPFRDDQVRPRDKGSAKSP